MPHTYEHRKHPLTKDKTLFPGDTTYHNADPAPQIPNRVMPDTASSINLDDAMQARMTRTFGDLSAVKNYTPPAQTQEPARTGAYSGPVTHTVSNAAPSPSAAGAMQAKRSWFGKKKKPEITKRETDLDEEPIIKNEPRSEYADDIDLLNAQKGSAEERKKAYNHIALDTANNMTKPQRKAITDYIGHSETINNYLREKKDDMNYPQPDQIPEVRQQAEDISAGIQNNPLPENVTAYKGITDTYLALMFKQHGLKKAVNSDGSVNHKWLNKNQKKLRKALVGSVFHDKAYTSTSTEKAFAQFWSRKKAKREKMMQMMKNGEDAEQFQNMTLEHPELIPGAHLMTLNMPKGSNVSFVDRVTDDSGRGDPGQFEVLADKGSSFRINDIRKMEGSDSYELVMDLLAEENGVKKGKKKKKK